MKIIIKSGTNSYTLNGVEYAKGDLSVRWSDEGMSIGGQAGSLSEIQCDGQVFTTITQLQAYVSANLFKSGGGSGGGAVESVTGNLVGGTATNPIIDNPLLEVHRLIITEGSTRKLTDYKGTLMLVTNGIDPANSFTLSWDGITDETRKLTVIFTFSASNITHTAIGTTAISRLPTSAKINDVWEVVYDKFYNTWDVVSTNLVGTNREVAGYVGGVEKPIIINVEHLTDIGGYPSFPNGVLTATAMNSTTKTGLLSFIRFSIDEAVESSFPLYGTGGVLKVGDAIANNDAVNLGQLNTAIANIPDIMSLSYTATGDENNEVTLSSGLIGAINPIIAVLPANTNAVMSSLDSGWSYNPTNGNITFDTTFLEASKIYTYTILIKKS